MRPTRFTPFRPYSQQIYHWPGQRDLRQTPKWGGNVVFLLKAVELLYVQLLKEKYADYWHFSSKKFTKKEVKVKGTSQNSIAITQISQIYNKQVSLFTKGNKKNKPHLLQDLTL